MLPEGLAKTVVNGGEMGASPIGRGDILTVKYTCYSVGLGDQDENEAENVLLARSDSQKVVRMNGASKIICSDAELYIKQSDRRRMGLRMRFWEYVFSIHFKSNRKVLS